MADVRALGRRLAPTERTPEVHRHFGVVTAVVTGPPKTVTVQISGSSTATTGFRYLAGYTPTIGDTVVIDRAGNDWLVIGVLA